VGPVTASRPRLTSRAAAPSWLAARGMVPVSDEPVESPSSNPLGAYRPGVGGRMHPGFIHQWRRARSCAQRSHNVGAGAETQYEAGASSSGPMFGVRRPLRVMAHELGLNDEQVERLARIIDELKTERAQAAVDERRSLGLVADALAGTDFDRAKVEEALGLRVRSAERLRDSVLAALSDTHALLDPEQRKKLSYLLRSGLLTI
jgi:Spy/CpxP family protein refolding chaperone